MIHALDPRKIDYLLLWPWWRTLCPSPTWWSVLWFSLHFGVDFLSTDLSCVLPHWLRPTSDHNVSFLPNQYGLTRSLVLLLRWIIFLPFLVASLHQEAIIIDDAQRTWCSLVKSLIWFFFFWFRVWLLPSLFFFFFFLLKKCRKRIISLFHLINTS